MPKQSQLILLLEQNEDLRDIICEMLHFQGHEVVPTTSVKEALTSIRKERRTFTIIISDYTVPEVDGIELFTTLQKEMPVLPSLILMTAVVEEFKALPLPPDLDFKFLPKPFSGQELLECIICDSAR